MHDPPVLPPSPSVDGGSDLFDVDLAHGGDGVPQTPVVLDASGNRIRFTAQPTLGLLRVPLPYSVSRRVVAQKHTLRIFFANLAPGPNGQIFRFAMIYHVKKNVCHVGLALQNRTAHKLYDF